jgi:hypothetical protein
MSSYIEIGTKTFRRNAGVQIKSSRKTLTDTASVKLPNLKALLDDPTKKISVGDKIEISLGYNGNNNVEFSGYVSEIKPTSPIELMCEDEMWQLKQQYVSKSWESVKLVDVLKFLVSSVNTTECPDITLAPFRLDKTTKFKALEKLKEEYGLDVYFRDKKLYAGLAYGESGSKKVKYHFQKNVPTSTEQTGLIYKRKSDVKIKVQAISLTPDNKKIQEDVGDPDGELHTLHFYNLTKVQLKQQATDMIDKMKYDGYRGTLKTFGVPRPNHGDIAQLDDGKYLDRAGEFFIDSVEIDYNNRGYRKLLELGKKASA